MKPVFLPFQYTTLLQKMFWEASFSNQDFGDWDTTNVTTMSGLFVGASSFNQDYGGWCVSNTVSQPSHFDSGSIGWTLPQPV